MSQPKSLADLKALCARKEKLRSVSKDMIVDIILSENSDDPGTSSQDTDIVTAIRQMTTEMKELKETNIKVVAALTRIDNLEIQLADVKKDNEKCFKIINQQQMFLESLDVREREKNVVIMGILETPDALGDSDEPKVQKVFDEIDVQIPEGSFETKRLGKPNERNKRPILVSFSDKSFRQKVLSATENLKESAEPFNRIFVKKDLHPAIRKEQDRLRKAEKEEKDKPENQGKTVKYDYKQRVLLRDGQIIDRFSPSFF